MSRGEQLTIRAGEVALLLEITVRHVWALNKRGLIPSPIRLGRSVRWNRRELARWVDAGCPTRSDWDAAKRVQAKIGGAL